MRQRKTDDERRVNKHVYVYMAEAKGKIFKYYVTIWSHLHTNQSSSAAAVGFDKPCWKKGNAMCRRRLGPGLLLVKILRQNDDKHEKYIGFWSGCSKGVKVMKNSSQSVITTVGFIPSKRLHKHETLSKICSSNKPDANDWRFLIKMLLIFFLSSSVRVENSSIIIISWKHSL